MLIDPSEFSLHSGHGHRERDIHPRWQSRIPWCIQRTSLYLPLDGKAATDMNRSGQATDPGIHFNPYQGNAANQAYVPPGGPIYPGLTFN